MDLISHFIYQCLVSYWVLVITLGTSSVIQILYSDKEMRVKRKTAFRQVVEESCETVEYISSSNRKNLQVVNKSYLLSSPVAGVVV